MALGGIGAMVEIRTEATIDFALNAVATLSVTSCGSQFPTPIASGVGSYLLDKSLPLVQAMGEDWKMDTLSHWKKIGNYNGKLNKLKLS
ncbi:unnamed protein product [Lupinus luteus]|uniref:Uncharacterized protein n=1 Tax=Lupinus luteus TaxID=3873 RepID=A0AAV1XQL9_LUPLU